MSRRYVANSNKQNEEPVNELFVECLEEMDENDPWFQYFADAAYGNLPWGIKFNNNRLIFKKNKNGRATYINLEDCNDIMEVISTVKKYFSLFTGNLEVNNGNRIKKKTRQCNTDERKAKTQEVPQLIRRYLNNITSDKRLSNILFEHLWYYYINGFITNNDFDISIDKINVKTDNGYGYKIIKRVDNIKSVNIIPYDKVIKDYISFNEFQNDFHIDENIVNQLLNINPIFDYLIDTKYDEHSNEPNYYLKNKAIIITGNNEPMIVPKELSYYQILTCETNHDSDFFENTDFIKQYLNKCKTIGQLKLASKNVENYWNGYLRKIVSV